MKPHDGYTLVEILVVIAIAGFLISGAIVLSRNSARSLDLVREQAKVAATINRAQNLAVSISIPSGLAVDRFVCGYGVYFDFNANNYFIYADVGTNVKCSIGAGSDKQWTPSSEDVEIISEKIDSEFIRFNPASSNVADVFFRPPKPIIFFDGCNIENTSDTPGACPPNPLSSREINLEDKIDASRNANIRINSLGLISLD